ncbi:MULTISPECIES: acetoacetyl-CoA reductase [unclassified Oleiphilus]|jgi:acetoacetyl-CoA reductase|uniref:acetoacetyl-CoA reductase n=2 Tax=Oleiphilus TaxID=141450 RepID=UPI0007C3C9FE|nr:MULTISPECIES: acetoacetyl-CoA reductase [unclassified Oleiphilus]KZY51542.1 beta-ketoacyl-ACP reductase [Oleiphilus sp. HI0050]KZY77391.1 beta-ketoacyl-ACP reductase [Oleiphilus sp. HI0068]KZY85328.1 beta-ketoacyl-ACP reductase [Oleiphilus sp. HI0069]KZY88409.1 beta-ketoacyl-ACP reductase [Oleiphilus sp. HI0072]KZZ10770.1 beta-ketoacyl-ACP reductase [Oleiphilus sp. HI0078]KZZ30299.1 beta-ketoacyl-ACP reductase [Oleiphilus sp. HI0081]KZZ47035.1 beta-ketoacyl-ACP reductase [Oleiphilus sp. H
MSNVNVAFVTGGTGGIGTAICQTLHDEGYTVVAASSSQEKADNWQAQLKTQGYDIKTCVLEVADFDSCTRNILDIEESIGPIAVLVNTAGITRDTSLKRMSPQKWQEVIDVNLSGTFNTCRNVIEFMLKRQYGRIINISSINGEKGQFGQVNYAASKAGIHGITMSLAQEVASKGITVNTISPGYIATEMVMAVEESIRNQIIAQIPVGRLGDPKEIARLVAFLSDKQSGFITGSNLSINGGQHMHH